MEVFLKRLSILALIIFFIKATNIVSAQLPTVTGRYPSPSTYHIGRTWSTNFSNSSGATGGGLSTADVTAGFTGSGWLYTTDGGTPCIEASSNNAIIQTSASNIYNFIETVEFRDTSSAGYMYYGPHLQGSPNYLGILRGEGFLSWQSSTTSNFQGKDTKGSGFGSGVIAQGNVNTSYFYVQMMVWGNAIFMREWQAGSSQPDWQFETNLAPPINNNLNNGLCSVQMTLPYQFSTAQIYVSSLSVQELVANDPSYSPSTKSLQNRKFGYALTTNTYPLYWTVPPGNLDSDSNDDVLFPIMTGPFGQQVRALQLHRVEPTSIAPPSTVTAPTVNSTGGTIPAGTWSYEFTYTNAQGETLPGGGGTLTTTGSTSSLTVTSPPASTGAVDYYFYIKYTSGAYSRQVSSATAIGTNLTITSLVNGVQVPIFSTAFTVPVPGVGITENLTGIQGDVTTHSPTEPMWLPGPWVHIWFYSKGVNVGNLAPSGQPYGAGLDMYYTGTSIDTAGNGGNGPGSPYAFAISGAGPQDPYGGAAQSPGAPNNWPWTREDIYMHVNNWENNNVLQIQFLFHYLEIYGDVYVCDLHLQPFYICSLAKDRTTLTVDMGYLGANLQFAGGVTTTGCTVMVNGKPWPIRGASIINHLATLSEVTSWPSTAGAVQGATSGGERSTLILHLAKPVPSSAHVTISKTGGLLQDTLGTFLPNFPAQQVTLQ